MSSPNSSNKLKKRYNVNDLNKMYWESERADKAIFADMRSNVLLVSGDHYTRKNARYWNRLRENRHLSQEQKIRLTKNHIQKITKTYVNNIVTHSPGVGILPNNEKETQDRKAAELNDAVWQDAKKTQKFKKKVLQYAHDYVEIGEVAVKLAWNPEKGKLKGYHAKVDALGNPVLGPSKVDPQTGQQIPGDPIPDENSPVFEGDFEFERIFGFNLLRPRGFENIDDAPWLCIRKMVHTDLVKQWVKDDDDKFNKVTSSTDSTYYVFEGARSGYDKAVDHTLVMEYYFKPSPMHPRGYYYIATKEVILFEGELPYGIWPIRTCGFDEIQTSARHRSIIKQLRPYQIEINRAASKIAEHQVTLGDDKLLIQSGTKLTEGVNLPGVRAMQYTGKDPIILSGRSGEQYVGYMSSQIEEMYAVANVKEDTVEKGPSQNAKDPFGQLFKSLKDKKKFTIYAEKFELFLTEICELYLELARHYFDEDRLIPMIGRNEYLNISEFKNTTPLSYQIKLEPRSDDIETLMGKQLTLNQVLQYTGSNMGPNDVGKVIKNMPFANVDESFQDMTLDYDMATNMILALDRGEQFQPNPYDDHQYMIKRLVSRMRMPDFKLLHPQIQEMYSMVKDQYEQIETRQQQLLLAAQNEFIPTGGAKIKCDVYVPKAGSPGKSERALLPTEAVNWLVQRLADQGSSQEQLKQKVQNDGQLSEMARNLLLQRATGQGAPQ